VRTKHRLNQIFGRQIFDIANSTIPTHPKDEKDSSAIDEENGVADGSNSSIH
jgi:hypothetical protein